MAERIFKHEQDEPPDVRTLNPDVPADLVAVMHQMLQKKPADGYQTPSGLLADLENPHGVKVYQSQSDGLSRLADLAEEESSRPAEPHTRVRSEPVTDLAADVAADVVDDLAEVPEEEVLIPAGKRTKRFRDQDAPPRAVAVGEADGARGAGAGKPGLNPIWWIIPSVSVL